MIAKYEQHSLKKITPPEKCLVHTFLLAVFKNTFPLRPAGAQYSLSTYSFRFSDFTLFSSLTNQLLI